MTDETPLGTTTLLADGKEVQLVDKKVVYEPVEFYNLITANHFNCFASNVLTSNRFNNLYHIQDYKFVNNNYLLSVTLIKCQPNSVPTGVETSPTGNSKASSSNG